MELKSPLLNFVKKYDTNEACYKILFEYKWKDGYQCRRCGSQKSVVGRTQFYKRCSSCKYDESCTAHTLFHKLKFPIVKAFAIIFQVATLKKGMSSCEIARQHGIHQETAWFFLKKLQISLLDNNQDEEFSEIQRINEHLIQSIKNDSNEVIADQIIQEKRQHHDKFDNRCKGSQKRVLSSFQSNIKQVKRKREVGLKKLITHQEERAVRTFHFLNLSNPNLYKFWPIFRRYNLRNWLIGVHHKVSIQHLIKYFAEFLFKLKYRQVINKLPLFLIREFVKHHRVPYLTVIAS
jgi:transposase-like protein